MIINIYAANSGAQNIYLGKTDRIEGEIDDSTVVGRLPYSTFSNG